ncbi:MAG: preprotein translocase subunit SecE [Anaerolineae bacterium CFX3]|nr:preprotein translocase subunit SecE [Anaerolineae bacterium]MBL1172518.1 preprotein translocase subunit SecE [Chloroflexota bacterium]MBV6466649.1 Protein translocase subunit SecE [Anaerolineales bacterium]MCE7906242.1 preprotein translocase subunit SecE [Anaerolineae bacterium CFX3]MDL1926299.1 preprotein translocase subunit SecE [Anaerolineae bacterium AMX1]
MADEKKPNAISRYFRETNGELRKVNWPTWPETWQLTLIVLAVMLVMSVYLGIVDGIGHYLITLIINL